MQIRKATTEDFDELMLFFERMNKVINERTGDYNPDYEIYPTKDMVAEAIKNQEQYVGIEDGKIMLGCIVNGNCPDDYNSVKWNVDAGKNQFHVIHALRIAPEYEHKGFGRQFISHLIKIAPSSGIKAYRLDVLDGYDIVGFYIKLGFVYIGTIDINYCDLGYARKFKLFEYAVQ